MAASMKETGRLANGTARACASTTIVTIIRVSGRQMHSMAKGFVCISQGTSIKVLLLGRIDSLVHSQTTLCWGVLCCSHCLQAVFHHSSV